MPSPRKGLKPAPKLRETCGHPLRSTGEPCQRAPMNGAKHCYLHGGRQELIAQVGLAAQNHGKGRSKYSAHILAGDAYEESLRNRDDMLSNTHEIALIESLIHRVGDDLAGITDPKLWEKLSVSVRGFRAAMLAKDTPAQMRHFTEIEAITAQGLAASNGIKSLREMLLERNRLVVDQNRMTIAAEQVVTREQVMGFVVAVARLINRVVTKKSEREAVQVGLIQMSGGESLVIDTVGTTKG